MLTFLNEFISHSRVLSLFPLTVHRCALISDFSAPVPHRAVTYNVMVYTRQLVINLDDSVSSCLHKQITSQASQLAGMAIAGSIFTWLLLVHN